MGRDTATDGGRSLVLAIRSTLADMTDAQHRLREFLVEQQVGPRLEHDTEFSFEELVSNVIRHGLAGEPPGTHVVDVEVRVLDDAVELRIEDDGRAFDPVSTPELPLPTRVEDARIGGLGLRMVRAAASAMTYERRDGRNRVAVRLDRA